MQVKCVPWLPSEPTAKKALDLVPVHCAMSAPVVTLREEMSIEGMRQILRQTQHNGFPVVRDTAAGQVLLHSSAKSPFATQLAHLGGPPTLRANPGVAGSCL